MNNFFSLGMLFIQERCNVSWLSKGKKTVSPPLYVTLCITALCISIFVTGKTSAESSQSEISEIDRILVDRYPLLKPTPLLKLLENYDKLPPNLIPKSVTVKTALEYSLKGSTTAEKKQTFQAEHIAKVVKILAAEVIVSPADHPQLESRVAITDTDLKSHIEKLYETILNGANQKALDKREAMRSSVVAELRRGKYELLNFDHEKYGKGFSGDYFPKLKTTVTQSADHEVPMGPIAGKALVLYNAQEATISELWPKGPGDKAGLKVGDRITEINGETFPEYPPEMGDSFAGFPEDLGMAIIEAQATGTPLLLTVDREGGKKKISIPLPPLPAFSDTYPVDCPRSSFLVSTAADWLAERQKDNGTWHIEDYTTAWTAMSLMSTGEEKYARRIKKAAHFFADKFAMKKDPTHEELIEKYGGGLDNWRHCMVGIFLAEYHLATGDEKVLPAIEACSRRMEARIQPETGRLGHLGVELAYKGHGLVLINTHAHILWALHAQINDNEWQWEPWDLSYKAVTAASNQPGIVGYSIISRGAYQSGTRSGSMATALVLADKEESTRLAMGEWLYSAHRRLPNTHGMTSLGLVFGFMGIKNANPEKLADCYQSYRWLYALLTPPHIDHGLFYYGQKTSFSSERHLDYQLVANWMNILTLNAHRSDTLWVFGNRKRGWYK